MSYSRALLAGWVKQGSPCCAAASVAGAWNALAGRSRSDAGALSSETVLRAMRAVIEEQIAAMTARYIPIDTKYKTRAQLGWAGLGSHVFLCHCQES